MRLVLLGAPGSGKGTQATMLAEKFGTPHISTGDIFRSNIKNGTELGKLAKEFIDKGMLVPDEVTIGIVKDRIQQSDCASGFILDGFPRTIPQADYLNIALETLGIKLDRVLNLYVDESEILKRMSGRRVCPNCSMSYHILYNLPFSEGICDNCKSILMQRDDDREETVLKRLRVYQEQTQPLIEYYSKKYLLVNVDGYGSVEEISNKLFKALGV